MSSVKLHETPEPRDDPFRAIVDTVPSLIWVARPDGSAEFLNARWLDYTGLSAKQALGWGWTTAVHPDDRSALIEYWRSILASGEPGEFEARLRRFDGEYRWFLFRGSPRRDAGGNIVQWCGTNTDIDDLRQILDSIPGHVTTTTATGEIEHINREGLEYFGTTLEELKRWKNTNVIHPEDLPSAIAIWRRAVDAGIPYEIEHRIRRADGVYRWFHLRARPARDANGHLIRWFHLVTDTEDRKRAEETARARDLDFRLILDSIPGLVATNDPTGETELINQQGLQYFGKTLEELKSWRTTDAVHPDDLARVVETIGKWMQSDATSGPYDFDLRLRRADGVYRWFELRAFPAHDSEGRVVRWYHLLTDIDERRRAEDALRSAQTRLAQATQVATTAELAASIAHEVNQPLAAVVTTAHACLRWLSAQPPNLVRARKAAERIVRDGKDAGEIVRRVRALFNRTEVEKVALDVNELIGEVLHLLEREVGKRRVTVETHFAEDLTPVVGDRVQLQQLILNLLVNGLESMELVLDRPRRLSIRTQRRTDNVALIEIHDFGCGLHDPDKAFEPFFTTKPNGLGMGLAICRSIIDDHDGQLWASSGEGPGTTFSFTLPLQRVAP